MADISRRKIKTRAQFHKAFKQKILLSNFHGYSHETMYALWTFGSLSVSAKQYLSLLSKYVCFQTYEVGPRYTGVSELAVKLSGKI